MKVKNPSNKAYYANEYQTFIHHYPDQLITNYTLDMIFHLEECYANLEQIYWLSRCQHMTPEQHGYAAGHTRTYSSFLVK